MVVPIFKKGDPEEMKNYRDISLLCTAYKIYAEILRARLEEENDKGKWILENQGGFRKGRGTTDNIFVLSHIVQKEKTRTDGKVFTAFIDIKAFDNVNRKYLWKILKKKGASRNLIWRLKKSYEDTWTTVKTGERLAGCFKLRKGVRQDCVMSLLFNLYMTDIDTYMKNGHWRHKIECGHWPMLTM